MIITTSGQNSWYWSEIIEYVWAMVHVETVGTLRTQNSEIVYLTLDLQIHAIHKLNN